MDFQHLPYRKICIALLEAVFIGNIILLDIWIGKLIQQTPKPAAVAITTQPTVTPPQVINPLADITPTIAISVTPTQQVTENSTPTVKEYYIPIGAGSSTAQTWTDVTGLQVSIDAGSYPKIKQAVFEASVAIPTGNETADVRLFNVTQQHPVWFSDVSLSGGQPQFLVSKPIILDAGVNIYQVQMQTQLQYPAILNQSRIHITLK